MIFIVISILLICAIHEYITLKKYKKLNEKNKSFLAAITHDLKSPTYAQINMLNLLLKGNFGKLNPEQYEMIKLTCTSSKYMSNLVGNILTNYEYESHILKLIKQEFDLIKLIKKICSENKYTAQEKDQNIIFSTDLKQCIVYGDELQIKRVILNLLSNAIKYGFNNTTIIITLNKNKDNIHFTITNISNPISQKDIKSIFNKYTRGKNPHICGTGLGLYIARKIIKMHNGEIRANSSPNGKCTFEFILKTNKCKNFTCLKT